MQFPIFLLQRLIDRHGDGIAANCKPENKVSLGFVEGLNNKIRVIQLSESADYVAGMEPTGGAIAAGSVLELATLQTTCSIGTGHISRPRFLHTARSLRGIQLRQERSPFRQAGKSREADGKVP